MKSGWGGAKENIGCVERESCLKRWFRLISIQILQYVDWRALAKPRLRGGYAEGLGDRSWKMKRGKLSKRPTTRWDELMVVR